MNCKVCGSPLMVNDQFCRNCGASVNEANAQNNEVSNQTTYYQNEFNSSVDSVQEQTNGGQTVNYQQPTSSQYYGNNYNYQPMYEQPKKSNNATKFIILGLLIFIVVVIVVIIMIGVALSGSDSNYEEIETPNTNINTNVNTSSGNSNKKNSTYTVKFEGFTFKIPTDLIYEVEDGAVAIGDEDGTWAAYIEVVEGSYNKMVTNKNQLQSIYQQEGLKSSSAVEKNIGGMQFLTLELVDSGTNILLGFSKANSMNIFGVTVYNIDNEFDYDVLKTIASILNNAEYNNDTNNMSTFKKVEMNGVSNLAK